MLRIPVAFMFALLSSVALADGFIGQASLSRAIRLKYMERTSGFGVSMLRRAVSSAAAKTACNIVAVRRPRTTLTPSLPAVPSFVSQSASTRMAARSQPVRSVAQTSATACAERPCAGLAPILKRSICRGSAEGRAWCPRNLEGQLCRAVALSRLYPRERKALRLL